MTLLILTIVLIGIIAIETYIFKKVYAPPVVLGVVFLISFMLIQFAYGNLENEYWFYACFIIAVIMFAIGFSIFNYKVTLSNKKLEYHIEFNDFYFLIFVVIAYIIAMYQIIDMVPLLLASNINAWQTIRREYSTSESISWLNLYISIFFLTLFTIYVIDNSKINKKNMLISIPCLIPVLLCANRGTWFMFIISCAFIFIFTNRPKNSVVLRICLVTVLIIALLVIVSSIWKYKGYFSSNIEIMKNVSKLYFGSQFVAFRKRMTYSHNLNRGQNTFRFIIALFNSLGITKMQPVNIVQPFINIYGRWTNVYTGLSYYATDFGMWWAYIMEFIFGLIFGFLYKRVHESDEVHLFEIIMISMLMYPLINQFFDDKFLSVTSQWLKYFIFVWIFTRKKIINISKKVEFENEK